MVLEQNMVIKNKNGIDVKHHLKRTRHSRNSLVTPLTLCWMSSKSDKRKVFAKTF